MSDKTQIPCLGKHADSTTETMNRLSSLCSTSVIIRGIHGSRLCLTCVVHPRGGHHDSVGDGLHEQYRRTLHANSGCAGQSVQFSWLRIEDVLGCRAVRRWRAPYVSDGANLMFHELHLPLLRHVAFYYLPFLSSSTVKLNVKIQTMPYSERSTSAMEGDLLPTACLGQ